MTAAADRAGTAPATVRGPADDGHPNRWRILAVLAAVAFMARRSPACDRPAGRQAPLFAAAGTLPPDRSTTGCAVLNMARQVGSAVGVALVVVILGAGAAHTTAEFQHVWAAEAVAGALAAIAAASSGLRRHPASARPSLRAKSPGQSGF